MPAGSSAPLQNDWRAGQMTFSRNLAAAWRLAACNHAKPGLFPVLFSRLLSCLIPSACFRAYSSAYPSAVVATSTPSASA